MRGNFMRDMISRSSLKERLKVVLNDPNCPLFVSATIDQFIDSEPSVCEEKRNYWKQQYDLVEECILGIEDALDRSYDNENARWCIANWEEKKRELKV